jgi:hypothetical protein
MRTTLIVLLLGLFATTGVTAQSQPANPLIDVRFPGGTATKYIEAIRDAAGDINVLIAKDVVKIQMPPVTLSKVSVAAALNLLDGKEQRNPNQIVRVKVNMMPRHSPNERETFQVRVDVRRDRERVPGAYVWSVSSLLDHDISSQALLSAVEMALDVIDSDTQLDVRFHEDTGLLIAMGDLGQMETIDGVLDQLQTGVDNRLAEAAQSEAAGIPRELMRFEIHVSELTLMLQTRNKELAIAREELRAVERELERERARRESRTDDSRR